jgi:hypothetical protein
MRRCFEEEEWSLKSDHESTETEPNVMRFEIVTASDTQNKSSFLMANPSKRVTRDDLSPPTRPFYGRCTRDRFGVC